MRFVLDVENTVTHRDGKMHLDPFEPDNSLVIGSPGKVIREVTEEEKKAIEENTKHYQDNWKKYSKSVF